MAELLNTTPLSAPISPGGDSDNEFGTHYAEYGIGGFQKVATEKERDLISVQRRVGKVVFVESTGRFCQFKNGIWEEIPITGTSGEGSSLEQIQDIVAAMFTNGSHEAISVIYDDDNGVFKVRLHGGSPSLTFIDPENPITVDPPDGTFGKPFSSITAARSDISSRGPYIVCFTSAEINGVHDLRGIDESINIFAPLAKIAGTFLVDSGYNHKIKVIAREMTAACSTPEALVFQEFNNEGTLHLSEMVKADKGFTTDGSVHVLHKNTNRVHTAFNEVQWKSYERDGSFSYPTLGMKFFTKNKRVAWLLAGVANETEWNNIVDHDTEDYTKWALATHITVGSGNTAAIEDHNFDESSGLYNVNIWYDNGKPESKEDIEKWLAGLTYTETNVNHESGNLYITGDAFINGQIHNEGLIHNVHNIKPEQPRVAIEAKMSRDYSIPYATPFGALVAFSSKDIDISNSLVNGELVAPYTGSYYVKLHLESETVATSSGDEYRIEFIRKKTSPGQPEYLVDAQSGAWKTRAIVTEINKPFVVDEEFVTILNKGETMEVRFINQSTTPSVLFRGGTASKNTLIVDSSNASMLDYSKLKKQMDFLMSHLEFDPNWKLVLNQDGKLRRRRIT